MEVIAERNAFRFIQSIAVNPVMVAASGSKRMNPDIISAMLALGKGSGFMIHAFALTENTQSH